MRKLNCMSSSKILVIRCDKLGDFALSIPAFALLKANLPKCQTVALVSEYVKPFAQIFPFIDHVIVDDKSIFKLAKVIKSLDVDSIIHLFLTNNTAWASLLANPRYRLAPKTKIQQFLFKNTLTQRRSHSKKAEYQYNEDVIYHFLKTRYKIQSPTLGQKPFWNFGQSEKNKITKLLTTHYGLDTAKKIIIIHAGSGGSASNLSTSQFTQLAQLFSQQNYQIIFTAGNWKEYAQAQSMAKNVQNSHIAHNLNAQQLCNHIAICDLFISGSTGPLHIAGLFNLKTVGFYPNITSSSPVRWKPPNESKNHLSFAPKKQGVETLESLDIQDCFRKIIRWIG